MPSLHASYGRRAAKLLILQRHIFFTKTQINAMVGVEWRALQDDRFVLFTFWAPKFQKAVLQKVFPKNHYFQKTEPPWKSYLLSTTGPKFSRIYQNLTLIDGIFSTHYWAQWWRHYFTCSFLWVVGDVQKTTMAALDSCSHFASVIVFFVDIDQFQIWPIWPNLDLTSTFYC